jgi:hypothetical protein
MLGGRKSTLKLSMINNLVLFEESADFPKDKALLLILRGIWCIVGRHKRLKRLSRM